MCTEKGKDDVTRNELVEYLGEFEALLADGFEEALIGYAFRMEGPVAL